MYTAVIFDFDGTLLNTLEDLADSLNYVLRRRGYPEHDLEHVREYVGNGVNKLIELALPDGVNDPDYDAVRDEFVEYYGEHWEVKTDVYDGIPQLLEKLLGRGMKLAISSNKNEREAKLLAQKWFPGMISAVAGNVPERNRKPAPDGVYAIMNNLGVTAENTVYVGDSDTDVKTAINSGLDCISVTWGYRDVDELKAAGAKRFANTAEELYDMLVGG